MNELVELHRNQLLVFLLVLVRVGGFVALVPTFGLCAAPKQVRVLLAIGLALLVAPIYGSAELPSDGAELLVRASREAVLGLVLGGALWLLIGGLQAAGQLIGQISGLSMAQLFDVRSPEGTPLLGRLFELTAIGTFLLSGGQRQVMSALLDSFQWMPPGAVGVSGGLLTVLLEIAGQAFSLALRVAAPVLAALLLTTLLLGILSRTVPQWNAMTIGPSVNLFVALAVLAVCLGGGMWIFQEQTEIALEAVRETLAGVRN